MIKPLQCLNATASSTVKITDAAIAKEIVLTLPRSAFQLMSAAALSSLFACSSEVTQGPMITMDPNGLTPLAGVIEMRTDTPMRVSLKVNSGYDNWMKEFADFQTNHYIPVLGLKPDSSYTIEVTVTDKAGHSKIMQPMLQVATQPLPVDFPGINVLISNPARMEPGYTLLDRFGRGNPASPDATLARYSMIVDNAGEVVWYSTLGGGAMRQLPNGNLFYRENSNAIETDLLGNEKQNTALDADDLHHDLFPTGNGTLLSLSRESVVVDNFPTSDTDPDAPTQTADIRDEPVVEFSSDGSILNKRLLTDILARTRIGYDSLNPSPLGYDWAHANAVLHDHRDDSIIVSLRHQDAVIKFSRSTGDLQWILGNHDNWPLEFHPYLLTPVGGPLEWPYHQHAPMITSSGTLLLFDNGNLRASPFDGRAPIPDNENYSRAVEYAIDEAKMEVSQVWEYGASIDPRYFSVFISDADSMENTGNVLITSGGTTYLGGVSSESLGMGRRHTRIIEVDHDIPAEKVFEMVIFNTKPESSITVYRSERIPDLYSLDTVLN